MNKFKKFGACVLAAAAIVATVTLVSDTQAQLGGAGGSAVGLGGGGIVALNYTGGDGYYFSQYGTNGATGWTNSPVFIEAGRGSSWAIYYASKGFSVNSSNAVTLAIKPAFSSATNDVATLAHVRIALTPTSTGVVVVTNITSLYAPGFTIELEDPSSNLVRLTNLVVKVWPKTP